MRKVIQIMIIILSILLIKYTCTYIINEAIITKYNQKKETNLINPLKMISKSYIVFYNKGNIFYQQGKYKESIKSYETALTKNPPKNRICDIHINLYLAFLKEKDLKREKEEEEFLFSHGCIRREEEKEEKNFKNQLQEINKESSTTRQKDLQSYENLDNYEYYSGNNW